MQYLNSEKPAHVEDALASVVMDEDARITSFHLALTAWFKAHQDMHCFLAIDPSQRKLHNNDNDDKTPFAALPRASVIIDHDGYPDTHLPYLVDLDLSTSAGAGALAQSVHIAFEDRRPTSMAEGLGQRVCGWLASPASLDEVAAHWSRLVLQRDDRGRACMLRFYDSRALALLWPLLSYGQQQAMLGPVRAWHVLDAGAKPIIHAASIDPRMNFILSTPQWQEIHRHGLVNRALALHAQTCGRQPEPSEIAVAVAAAARAEQYGLIDRDDWVAFIGHALAWHPQFDLYPKVLQLLERRAADDLYTSEIEQLSADEIAEIRRGCWYERLDSSALR